MGRVGGGKAEEGEGGHLMLKVGAVIGLVATIGDTSVDLLDGAAPLEAAFALATFKLFHRTTCQSVTVSAFRFASTPTFSGGSVVAASIHKGLVPGTYDRRERGLEIRVQLRHGRVLGAFPWPQRSGHSGTGPVRVPCTKNRKLLCGAQ